MKLEAPWVGGYAYEEPSPDAFCENCGKGIYKDEYRHEYYGGEIVCTECYRKLKRENKDYDTYCDCCGKGIFTDDEDSFEYFDNDTLCIECYEKVVPIINNQIKILKGMQK